MHHLVCLLHNSGLAAGIAQDKHGLMMDKGRQLYHIIKREENPIIKDRKYHFRNYQKCFVGKYVISLVSHDASSDVT